MNPTIALILCLLFIVFLYINDAKQHPETSCVIWIPLIWFLIVGSRPVSIWLNMANSYEVPSDYLEGSPLDASIFVLLTVAGIIISYRRKTYWLEIAKINKWLFLFFLYCALSIAWSDFPFISFKRWIKFIGSMIVVIVVFTENDPVEAIKTLIRRWAYALIPLSVVLIKYFPDLGRSYDRWTGNVHYSGVGYDKNALGFLCLISGLFFVWNILTMPSIQKLKSFRQDIFLNYFFLTIICWLFYKAQSATSASALIIGTCIIVILNMSIVKRNIKNVEFYSVLAGIIVLLLYAFVDVKAIILKALGRDPTFTGRTELWDTLMDIGTNSLFGCGYESFWLGNRMEKVWETYWWHPNQAHNGYLEIYLNLGGIGLVLLACVIYEAYRNWKLSLVSNFNFGRLRLAFLCVFLLCNYTEATFKGLHPILFMFLLVEMRWPLHLQVPSRLLNKGGAMTLRERNLAYSLRKL